MSKTLSKKEQEAYIKLDKVMDAIYTRYNSGASILNDTWINLFNLFLLLENDKATDEDIIKSIDLVYNYVFKGRA